MKPTFALSATISSVLLTWTSFASPIDINLLTNPGFELELLGWTTDRATIRQNDPPPHSGTNYLMGGRVATSYTYQTVDLIAEGFDPNDLDSGRFEVHFGGWQAGWGTQTDSGMIEIICHDQDEDELLRTDLGWFYSNKTWTLKEDRVPLPPNARTITYGFHALRFVGANNDAYLDDAFLMVGPQRPVITAIGLADSLATLQITNLLPGLSYTVLRSPTPAGMYWTDRDTFEAESPATNWLETVDPEQDPISFYRILLNP